MTEVVKVAFYQDQAKEKLHTYQISSEMYDRIDSLVQQ